MLLSLNSGEAAAGAGQHHRSLLARRGTCLEVGFFASPQAEGLMVFANFSWY